METTATTFPSLGVRISYFNDFIRIYGGKDALKGKTTNEICQGIVKNTTTTLKISWCEYLHVQDPDHPFVGEANIFISHAWSYKFLEVVEALQDYFRGRENETVVWFDVFTVNQHKPLEIDFFKSFQRAISRYQNTVVVFAPWNDPKPLHRAWCIWELYCTVVNNCELEIAMSGEQQLLFIQSIKNRGEEPLDQMLSNIDSAQSDCEKPEDRDRIHELVQQQIGFEGLNALIFRKMRDWAIKVAKETLRKEERRDDNISEQIKLRELIGTLYYHQGVYSTAEEYLVQTLEQTIRIFGQVDPFSCKVMNNLGLIYDKLGRYDEAENYFISCYASRSETLGRDHIDTLVSMNNLALLYVNQKEYTLAEPLHEECYQLAKDNLGEDHPHTLRYLNNLIVLYQNQHQYQKAETFIQRSYNLSKETLGEYHPTTLTNLHNLAMFYYNTLPFPLALVHFQDYYNKIATRYDENHSYVLRAMYHLALVYDAQDEYELAKFLYTKCFKKRKELLGIDHPDTQAVYLSLVALLGRENPGEWV